MKLLDSKIKNSILYRFPKNNIKNLNIFNQSSNNKILFNSAGKYYILKCKGKKSYIWFTYFEKKLLCILILINNKKLDDLSNEFYEIQIDYDNALCYNNVLLYGYYFKASKCNYFMIENVYNFNIYNNIIESINYNNLFSNKLKLFNEVVINIQSNNKFRIVLPIILDNNNDLFKIVYNLDYNIYSIHVYSDIKYIGTYIFNNNYSNNKITATFRITASINNDLYNLFIVDGNKEIFYELALIDSYKTSVFMNELFRNIKENQNLDLLEESDEEDEFENINIDKYVNLEKSISIDCEYNSKFKKWVPKNISKNPIIHKKNLQLILNKKNINILYKK